MTDPDTLARNRYLAITLTRIIGSAGAVLGVILIGRAQTLEPRIIGTALVIASMIMIATVPRALARRWRTPPNP